MPDAGSTSSTNPSAIARTTKAPTVSPGRASSTLSPIENAAVRTAPPGVSLDVMATSLGNAGAGGGDGGGGSGGVTRDRGATGGAPNLNGSRSAGANGSSRPARSWSFATSPSSAETADAGDAGTAETRAGSSAKGDTRASVQLTSATMPPSVTKVAARRIRFFREPAGIVAQRDSC